MCSCNYRQLKQTFYTIAGRYLLQLPLLTIAEIVRKHDGSNDGSRKDFFFVINLVDTALISRYLSESASIP
jgi:hypothetical protein